ncbi:hypothetical protein G6F66_014481 [Rhizopus arrhizus]|nr:hypothetical protein G6F66_014481 [Rhizopus arrhizus]
MSRLAAAVVDQHVLVVPLAAGDAAVQFFAGAAVGPAAGQQFAQFLVHGIAPADAQHALEAVGHIDDAAITAGHRNGVAGFGDAQEQQADLFLALGIGNRLALDDRNAHDLAIIVLQRQISGLDP